MNKLTKGDTIPGICSVLMGIFGLYCIFSNSKMKITGNALTGVLGPGFFPLVCSVALVILGVFLIIRGLKQNGKVDFLNLTPETKKNFITIGLIVGSCLALLIVWKITKKYFIICLFIYALIINVLLKRSKWFILLFAVIMTAFIYGLFVMGFGINFRP